MQVQNYHEIEDVCYDALTYLEVLLNKESKFSVHKQFANDYTPIFYSDYDNYHEFDSQLKDEVKKYGDFRLIWNFNRWYRHFELGEKNHYNLTSFFSVKFKDEITSVYLDRGVSQSIIGRNNQLKLFSNYSWRNCQELHLLNKKKVVAIEHEFQNLLQDDCLNSEAKNDLFFIIHLIDTVQSTLTRIDPKPNLKLKTKSNFGSAKGLIEMSPDFDAPLEDFKDYM